MNSQIKNYDELNDDEHYVLDIFSTMKMECDKARFELLSYKINELLNGYQDLKQLREEIRVKYFAVLQEIDASEFATVDVNYEKWHEVLGNENANWNEEVKLLAQFNNYLDGLIEQLNNFTIERGIIEESKFIN